MNIIAIENTAIFTQTSIREEGYKSLTEIVLPEDLESDQVLHIAFNPDSSLYDEENYDGKHPCAPPANFCTWEIWTKPFINNDDVDKVGSQLTDCKTCGGYGAIPTQGGYNTEQCPDCDGTAWWDVA